MSSTQSQQTIAVVGTTGIQGSGVVRALLSDEYGGPWFVRALTQDPSSGKAQKLLSEYLTTDNRLSLVSGNVYDEPSLRSAFTGAYGVFATTSERYPGKLITEEWELKHEINAGRNIISAAKECCIKHLVFSSLPDTVKASDGQFKRIHHMNNKHTIEQLARKELDGFTSLIPGVEKTKGQTYLPLGPRITPQGMAKVFTRVTGKPAVHSPISFEEFGRLSSALVGPAFKEDAIEMMQWAAVALTDKTCYGAFELEAEQSIEELGLTASSFEDWLRRSGWTGS
ncbi:hypothetical protein BFJ63_vAg16233 [Fusarium oxysporum f. sp. narcissi]|uniref:NmrA-like domain-containing protein n=1 Tax=Fusarium oxysporum f. sp. narcissi TaxID=451672 RepID=A0A4Q2V9M4_FUSOX|nr:hypothetical protein BFJ63_vAg16233 [Fusarium oxysporum f. sp. narcissi]